MSDDSTRTISARFATRDAAERAVEHLVQEHGIDRADIFIEASRRESSAGTSASGADASERPDEGSAFDPALRGAIEVSADVSQDEIATAEEVFQAAGATDIVRR